MVGMIQRIFHSFEHYNHGALYPPPEGTGFTARVISAVESTGQKQPLVRRDQRLFFVSNATNNKCYLCSIKSFKSILIDAIVAVIVLQNRRECHEPSH